MNVSLIRIYYAALLVVFLPIFFRIGHDVENLQLTWPVLWMSYVPAFPAFATVAGLLTLSGLGCLRSPNSVRWRIAVAFTLFIFGAIVISYNSRTHSIHGWILTSWIMIFISAKKDFFVYALRAQVALPYFLAGVWKLRALTEAADANHLLSASLPSFIAYKSIQTGVPQTSLIQLLTDFPLFSATLWILTVSIELAGIALVKWPRILALWGLGIITFHFLTRWTLQISFTNMQILVLIVLVLPPILSRKAKQFI